MSAVGFRVLHVEFDGEYSRGKLQSATLRGADRDQVEKWAADLARDHRLVAGEMQLVDGLHVVALERAKRA